MFGTIRKHSQALWIPIIIVIVISFVIYFTPGVDPFENSGPSRSESDDDELSFARNQVLLQQALSMSQQFGGFLPPQITAQSIASQFAPQDLNRDGDADVPGLDYQAHLRLLRLRKARSVGIVVSDNMVKARLEQMFSNPNDKKFSAQNYSNFLDQYRAGGFLQKGLLGETQFQELIRAQIILGYVDIKIQFGRPTPVPVQGLLDELMTRSIGFFSDQTTAGQLAEENKKYTAQVIFFSTSNRVSEVTNFSTTATNFTKYYQGVANQYFVQPNRKVAHVLFSATNYLAEAKKKIQFDELVNKRRDEHNSTNKVHHLTDASGTNKLTGTNLDDALYADVLKNNQADLDEETLPKAKDKATKFRRKLFEGTERARWNIAHLRAEAEKEKLPVHSTVISQANEEPVLPQALIDALYALPDSAAGMLSTTAVEVSGKGYYVFGLEEVIPGRPRKYQELSKDEQLKIKEDFIENEVKRLAREEAKDWRDTVAEFMAKGTSFSDSTKLSRYEIISLPAMTISERDVNATALKSLATISEIQSVISDLERENRSTDKPNWLSSYNASSTEGVGGFIVYVSKVENGDARLPAELGAFASRQRQMARNFNSSSMAARFGMTPAWIRQDIDALNHELVKEALKERLKNIGDEIEQAQSEVSELEKLIAKAETTPKILTGSVTLEGLKADLGEAKTKLRQLEELRSNLPEKLRETRQPKAQN